eukprot:m.241587 g.241587  ORF g.241587 m.241587 type:complete len:111 (-) comp54426_c0_seq13:442-774(-)
MYAALHNHFVCVRMLVHAAARTHTRSQDERTALDLARDHHRTEIVEFLEDHERLLAAQQDIKPAARHPAHSPTHTTETDGIQQVESQPSLRFLALDEPCSTMGQEPRLFV